MVRYLHALCTSLKNLVINTNIKRKIGELLLTRLLGGILFNNNRSYCNLLRFMQFTKQSSTRFLVDSSVAASKVCCAKFSSFFFSLVPTFDCLGIVLLQHVEKTQFSKWEQL